MLKKKFFPDDEFWNEEDGVSNISGTKFKKACDRAQKKKDEAYTGKLATNRCWMTQIIHRIGHVTSTATKYARSC